MPLKSKLKKLLLSLIKHYGNEEGDLYDPRVGKNLLENIPILSKNLLKALTGDCGALIGEWADLQKR